MRVFVENCPECREIPKIVRHLGFLFRGDSLQQHFEPEKSKMQKILLPINIKEGVLSY